MRGRTDEQRYAILSPYFDGRIKMNGPYPEITNISFLAKDIDCIDKRGSK
jgi:hypothetical protein